MATTTQQGTTAGLCAVTAADIGPRRHQADAAAPPYDDEAPDD